MRFSCSSFLSKKNPWMEVQEKDRTEMSDTYLLTEHIYQHFVAES